MEIRINKDVECIYNCDPNTKKVIYKLTFPNGKIYIGQTKNELKIRIKQHCCGAFNNNKNKYNDVKHRAIRKYKHIIVDIICVCDSVDELNICEDELINKYKSDGYQLYNVANGGLNNCDYLGVRCYLLDTSFNIIKEFNKVKEVSEYIGCSQGTTSKVNKYHLVSRRYYIMSTIEYNSITQSEHLKLSNEINIIKKQKRKLKGRTNIKVNAKFNIIQVDYNHNVVSIIDYDDALNQYGIQIQRVINNKVKYAYGYYWIKETDIYNIGTLNGLNVILKLNSEGVVLDSYKSISESSKQNNINIKSIRLNIMGVSKLTHGFIFMWSDKYRSMGDINKHFSKDNVKTTISTNTPKIVNKYDISGQLISTYNSINLAALYNRTNHKVISHVCRGVTKTYKGYIYSFS